MPDLAAPVVLTPSPASLQQSAMRILPAAKEEHTINV